MLPPRLEPRESDEHGHSGGESCNSHESARHPLSGRAQHADQDERDAGRQRQAPGEIDRIGKRGPRLSHASRHDRESDHAEGKVDREYGSPSEVDGEKRTEQRSHQGRESPDSGKQALNAGALLERVDVGRDRHRDGNEPRRAQTLERPGADQLRHRPRKGAGDRAG